MEKKKEFCFWCDKRIPKIINNYTPCENCQKIITKGIVIIEVQDIPMQMDQPSLLIPNNYPTGTWMLLRPETVDKVFEDEVTSRILKDKIAFLDRGMLVNLGLRMEEKQISTIQ